MIAEGAGELRFAHGVDGCAYNSGDSNGGVVAQFFHRDLEHGPVETNRRTVDGELSRVDADRDSSSPSGEIIAREGTLASRVELALRSEGESVRRTYHTFAESFKPRHHQNFPSRASK